GRFQRSIPAREPCCHFEPARRAVSRNLWRDRVRHAHGRDFSTPCPPGTPVEMTTTVWLPDVPEHRTRDYQTALCPAIVRWFPARLRFARGPFAPLSVTIMK